jgi:hypothetical protein
MLHVTSGQTRAYEGVEEFGCSLCKAHILQIDLVERCCFFCRGFALDSKQQHSFLFWGSLIFFFFFSKESGADKKSSSRQSAGKGEALLKVRHVPHTPSGQGPGWADDGWRSLRR